MSNILNQKTNQEIWNKHAKEDKSVVAAQAALEKLGDSKLSEMDSPDEKRKLADVIRQSVVSSKSAALKTSAEEASTHLQNSIRVLLEHYPASANEKEAQQRSKDWEDMVIENQSSQLICLRDMLSLLEFVSKVAQSEETNHLKQQILVLLLELSEEKPLELFALISLIERADYGRATEAFKTYLDNYCPPNHDASPDQVITVSTRFLERTIKEKDFDNSLLALQKLFEVLFKDKSYALRAALDMARAIFPDKKNEIIEKAANGIREEEKGREKLNRLVQSLLNLSYVGIGGEKVKKLD